VLAANNDASAADAGDALGSSGNRWQAAEQELVRCRADIAGGHLAEASRHVAWALALAPDHEQVYAVLEEFAAAVGSNAAAREYFKGSGGNVPGQNAAAIITLIAAEGDFSTAVQLLGSLVAIEPARPWAAAPWFTPQLAQAVPARAVAKAVNPIFDAVGYPEDSGVRAALLPWLAVIRGAAARPDAAADVLRVLSGAARRLEAAAEAVAWCEKAVALDRKAGVTASNSLVMLGLAQRDAGEPARAAKSWEAALKLAPNNVALLLDLSDLAFAQKDYATSLRWAERASAIERGSAKVRGAVLSAKVRASGISAEHGMLRDADSMAELFGLALADRDNGYLRTLITRTSAGLVWLNVVPPPTEALAASIGEEARRGDVIRINNLSMMVLEPPSAVHGVRMRHPEVQIEVGEVPEPDLRRALQTEYGPAVWSYRGTRAEPAVPPPSAHAVALVYEVAAGVWADPLAAYERAAPLGALSAEDLLGLLAHVPAPGEVGNSLDKVAGLYWNRVVQAWVCIGILHHRALEEAWPTSARRGLLLRLLHGPEDWTVDAAAFALCLAAWIQPQHNAAIAHELAARYRFAAEAVGRRVTSLHTPLAAVVLACPGMDRQVLAQAGKNLGIQRQGEAEAAPERNRLRRLLGARGVRVVPGDE